MYTKFFVNYTVEVAFMKGTLPRASVENEFPLSKRVSTLRGHRPGFKSRRTPFLLRYR